MKVNLIRDECLTFSIYDIGDGLIEVEADIPEKKVREIKKAERQYWALQSYLEDLYEKHRK
jgi:hypothetical protein